MTRHALTGGAIAVVVGFVLLLGLPESVDENGPVDCQGRIVNDVELRPDADGDAKQV